MAVKAISTWIYYVLFFEDGGRQYLQLGRVNSTAGDVSTMSSIYEFSENVKCNGDISLDSAG